MVSRICFFVVRKYCYEVGLRDYLQDDEKSPDTLGISLEEMSDELRENLQTADIVIAKGQANYYALSECRPKAGGKIACLFRTKCDYVSNVFGKNGKVNLAVIL
ncbi:hypothetical protein CEE35_03605 [Candidatus Aerophobetes bacterium Ae_b3b]|nr:MAG: hypothetical protein CEE35_03605 [Candidatus Aerophobetes bacterium Ae_b3b]